MAINRGSYTIAPVEGWVGCALLGSLSRLNLHGGSKLGFVQISWDAGGLLSLTWRP